MQVMELHDVIAFCEDTARGVDEGKEDALANMAEMRAVVAAAQDALKVIEPFALAEAEKYHEKTFDHGGLTWRKTEGRRMFAFDHLPQWAEAKRTLAEIEERAKNAALQAEKKLVVAGEDGVIEDAAIMTFGKPTLSIVKG